jgi:hypothetical protein
MTLIDESFVETLLNMSESDVLDFKRDQYPFAGASDEAKSEIVKDVLAFANAWKTDDAHIVVGVDETPGGRATVVGVDKHLKDADLQQLVNSKTNTPVAFEYVPITIDNLSVGIVRIRRTQQRPCFLKRAFGKLQPNIVYIRRGSSTAEADPAEIARMGTSLIDSRRTPQLTLELADPKERTVYGAAASITSTVLRGGVPRALAMPGALDESLSSMKRFREMMRPVTTRSPWTEPDPEKLLAYKKEMALLARLGFCVKNMGTTLAEDARVLVQIPKHDGLNIVDALPERPRGLEASFGFIGRVVPASAMMTKVSDRGDHWEITARLGKIQPDATAWSKPFWMSSSYPHATSFTARLFGDNIPKPIDAPFRIDIEVKHGHVADVSDYADDDE